MAWHYSGATGSGASVTVMAKPPAAALPQHEPRAERREGKRQDYEAYRDLPAFNHVAHPLSVPRAAPPGATGSGESVMVMASPP